VNRKRVRRLYRLEGLQLRMRVRRRKHIALHRGPAPLPIGPTERWSMDFVHDVDLIRLRGHLPKGGYDVRNGRLREPTVASAVHR
jgi:hypothetical protein